MRKKSFNSFAEALLSTTEGRKLFYRSKRRLKRERQKETAKDKGQKQTQEPGYIIFDWMEE